MKILSGVKTLKSKYLPAGQESFPLEKKIRKKEKKKKIKREIVSALMGEV